MKVCNQCGYQLEDEATYCPRCGSGSFSQAPNHDLNGNPAQSSQPRAPQQRPPQQRPPQQRPSQQRPPQQNQGGNPGYNPNQGYNQNNGNNNYNPNMGGPINNPNMQGQRPMNNGQGFNPNMQGQRPMNNGQGPNLQKQNPNMQGQRPMNNGQNMNQPMNEANYQPEDDGLDLDTGDNKKQKKQKKQKNIPNNNVGYDPNIGMQDIGYSSGYTDASVVTVKEWLINMLLMMIPIYGFIRLIIIAVGGPKYKLSMTNMFRASLIFSAVVFVITFAFALLVGGSMFAIFKSIG